MKIFLYTSTFLCLLLTLNACHKEVDRSCNNEKALNHGSSEACIFPRYASIDKITLIDIDEDYISDVNNPMLQIIDGSSGNSLTNTYFSSPTMPFDPANFDSLVFENQDTLFFDAYKQTNNFNFSIFETTQAETYFSYNSFRLNDYIIIDQNEYEYPTVIEFINSGTSSFAYFKIKIYFSWQ